MVGRHELEAEITREELRLADLRVRSKWLVLDWLSSANSLLPNLS